jgi:hypothetical protein
MKCLACDNPAMLLSSGKSCSVGWCEDCRDGWINEGHDFLATKWNLGGTSWNQWVAAGRPGLDTTPLDGDEPECGIRMPTCDDEGQITCDCGAKLSRTTHATWCSVSM